MLPLPASCSLWFPALNFFVLCHFSHCWRNAYIRACVLSETQHWPDAHILLVDSQQDSVAKSCDRRCASIYIQYSRARSVMPVNITPSWHWLKKSIYISTNLVWYWLYKFTFVEKTSTWGKRQNSGPVWHWWIWMLTDIIVGCVWSEMRRLLCLDSFPAVFRRE